MAFRIFFIEWIDPDKLPIPSWSKPWLYPQFDVYEEARHLFLVNLQVHKDPAASIYGDREDQFKDALLRYAVSRIEDALGTHGFLTDASERMREMFIGETELPFIEKLIEDKKCDYQIKEGRNLFCSAGSPEDYDGTNLSQRRVPTSRPICFNCDFPDADYLCSNLSHPAIMSQQGMGAPFGRFVVRALGGVPLSCG